MARTWFAGHPATHTVPLPKNPNDAVSKQNDAAQSDGSVSAQNQIAVPDFPLTHQTIPEKETLSNFELDISGAWVAPSSSSQKEPYTQQTKEVLDASAILIQLMRRNSTLNDPQTAAASDAPTTSEPVEITGICAPSPSARCRAPIAQMVPLQPNAAVTTTPAVATHQGPRAEPLLGQCPRPASTAIPPASFPATAPASLLSLPSVMVSTRADSLKKSVPQSSTPGKPKDILTPAPATAPSSFKDAAPAAHVQNKRFTPPAKQRTTGVTKRQYVKAPLLPKPVSRPESVAEGKRGRNDSRTSSEEGPLGLDQRYRPPGQPRTPSPRSKFHHPANTSLLGRSTTFISSPFQQEQERYYKFDFNGDVIPKVCSEEPGLWPGRGDYVASLQSLDPRFHQSSHSEPIKACVNRAAHQAPREPHGHSVCSTCRTKVFQWIQATRPELWLPAWWPLCKVCGDSELRHSGDPGDRGCSCVRAWLCFECQTHRLEMREVKNAAEAEVRRTIIATTAADEEKRDGDAETAVSLGWACRCGGEVEADANVMICVGCQGLNLGRMKPQAEIHREQRLKDNALAWT